MTTWRCCSECSIPPVGASEQLGLREQARLQPVWDTERHTHTHTHTTLQGTAQYLSSINSIMNIWIYNASIKGFRVLNINTSTRRLTHLQYISDVTLREAGTYVTARIKHIQRATKRPLLLNILRVFLLNNLWLQKSKRSYARTSCL